MNKTLWRRVSVTRWLKNLCVIVVATGLHGCNGVGVVKEVKPSNPPGPVVLGTNHVFTVTGTGTCGMLTVDFSDGTEENRTNVDLASNPTFSHTFTGWAGGKTITATGTQSCTGRVNTRFTIDPPVYKLGYAQPGSTTACDPIPNRPPLPVRSLVHVTTDSSPLISFGCLGGCSYGADGRPGSSAGNSFPFPGLREYSLVLRVGSQVVQGGSDVRFTTTGTGRLEVCQNDDRISDNNGGWGINIAVDMLGPP